MCLAIPAEITAIDPTTSLATVSLGGVTKQISLAFVDDCAVGDFVLVHVGYALSRLDREEAAETLALMAAAGALDSEVAG